MKLEDINENNTFYNLISNLLSETIHSKILNKLPIPHGKSIEILNSTLEEIKNSLLFSNKKIFNSFDYELRYAFNNDDDNTILTLIPKVTKTLTPQNNFYLNNLGFGLYEDENNKAKLKLSRLSFSKEYSNYNISYKINENKHNYDIYNDLNQLIFFLSININTNEIIMNSQVTEKNYILFDFFSTLKNVSYNQKNSDLILSVLNNDKNITIEELETFNLLYDTKCTILPDKNLFFSLSNINFNHLMFDTLRKNKLKV